MLKPMNKNKRLFINSTIIGTIVDIVLVILKIFTGLKYFSHALVLDGFHSLSDVVTDFFVLFISKFSNESPDELHPYGHEKIETLGTLTLGSLLMATSGALLFEVLNRIYEGHHIVTPGKMTIVITIFSIVVKELLFRYQFKIGTKINSQILIANAWHHRSDSYSSIAVLIGLIFTLIGYPIFDSIAAIIVVLFIGKVAWQFISDSIQELVETSLDQSTIKKIKQIIRSSEGVIDFHSLRSRNVGPNSFIDVNIQVDNNISVSEGHEIGVWVERNIKKAINSIVDVTVHIDVEDDLIVPYRSDIGEPMPLRKAIINDINKYYSDEKFYRLIKKWDIHYLNNKVNINIIFKINDIEKVPISDTELIQKCDKIEYLNNINFIYIK